MDFTDPNNFPWLIPSVSTIMTGLIAFAIAYQAIYSNRDIARKKNSIDTILHAKNDGKLRNAITVTGQIHNNADKTIKSFAYESKKFTKGASEFRYCLNFYEYISVGIRHGIYDEIVMKESMCGTVTRVYERCKPFIQTLRLQNQAPTAYCEFERLAE
ncbi:DUF4760 domain-containing protein [Psychrosphaera algicola]|uniref:DUF4760 domain-containing protein n=1 Tax=Psychrosphaera algicola TaxID=3023714 RepID=A0ABT5FD19_9GAMM|nr:DUF4760 domain-containing protein [Psychrosphaera sp. G1-22]MDC2888827.1 DUF4760 domain-containing protein [Psychrosphaera sp. G1-22]